MPIMEKGKQPIQEEDEDLLINCQPNNSSPLPSSLVISLLEESKNPSQDKAIDGGYIIIDGNTKSPSELHGSGSKPPDESLMQVVLQTMIETKQDTTHQQKLFRNALTPQMLAKIAMDDPKRARRILTNRMSAMRAKEKKKLYTCMLGHRMQSLLAESNALSAHLTLIQRETRGLNNENTELKEEISKLWQQSRLQDTINDEIRNEIQELKLVRHNASNHGAMLKSSSNGYFGLNIPTMEAPLGAQQFPHLLPQNQYEQVHSEIEQMNFDHNLYKFRYEQGVSSRFQELQQQYPLCRGYQGQHWKVQARMHEADLDTEESGTDDLADGDSLTDQSGDPSEKND